MSDTISIGEVPRVELVLGEVSSPPQGIKSAPITLNTGKQAKILLGDKRNTLSCPFEPSAYEGKGDRVPVDFRIESDVLSEAVDALDRKILREVVRNKARLFKDPKVASKSDAEIENMYVPLRKAAKDPKYSDTLRTKATLGERPSVKIWNLSTGKPTFTDDFEWRRARFVCSAHLSKVWFQGKTFGATLELEHLGIQTESLECPFELTGDFEV